MNHPARRSPETPAPSVPLSEQAYLRLRSDVIGGQLAPDTKLKLELLFSRYGLSSSPLREALNRLAQEGLVSADERRGFRVAPLSLDDLADITAMRKLIDVPALADAIAHGDEDWECAIAAAFHRLNLAEKDLGDGPLVLDGQWEAVHRDFHLSLLAGCPSARQRALSASLFDQAERYRRFSARFRQTIRRKNQEHKRLMNAALQRDAATACALLEQHIEATRRNVEAAASKGLLTLT